MNGSVDISINPAPTAFEVTGGGSYCIGDVGKTVGLASSEPGVNYQLQINGSESGSPVSGTGSLINFGIKSNAGTYTVAASNGSTGCSANMSGSVDIVVNSLPVAYDVIGGGNYWLRW